MSTTEVSAQKLVETGAHFGHQMRRWNPRMKDFLYKVQDNTFIFDLIKTKAMLEEALEFMAQEAKSGKKILFVGTKKQIKEGIVDLAKATNNYYIVERWLGGTFTNFEQIKKSLHKMEDMKKKLANGEYASYTKKERLLISRDIEKLERMIGGLAGMEKLPDVVFVVDTHKEETAVSEARRLKVPVVGIVDSNGDPDSVDYAIPMNDDASQAVSYILELIKETLSGTKETPKAEKTKSTKVKKSEENEAVSAEAPKKASAKAAKKAVK
jgi:small subunit ribosomal protein S2